MLPTNAAATGDILTIHPGEHRQRRRTIDGDLKSTSLDAKLSALLYNHPSAGFGPKAAQLPAMDGPKNDYSVVAASITRKIAAPASRWRVIDVLPNNSSFSKANAKLPSAARNRR